MRSSPNAIAWRIRDPSSRFSKRLRQTTREMGAIAMAMTIGVVLFPDFEILDVFGPAEMLGMHPESFQLRMVAETRGEVSSVQGPRCLADDEFGDGIDYDAILVPGGQGTRREVSNTVMVEWLERQATLAQFVTSVCTGSALLAKTAPEAVLRTARNGSGETGAMQGPLRFPPCGVGASRRVRTGRWPECRTAPSRRARWAATARTPRPGRRRRSRK